jgi:hypothetical protein
MERRRNARLKQLAVRMFKQAEFRCFNMWRSAWQECKYALLHPYHFFCGHFNLHEIYRSFLFDYCNTGHLSDTRGRC